uniref:Proteasome subunit beta n=1 Tax=Syphacia muris TaxID=451379 RepID=A0A0N5AP89_9BILA
MSGINFLAGISTKDYVLLAADRACYAYGAIIVSDEQDKKFMLGNKLIMLCIGEDGDVAQFGDWTQRNIQLYKIRYGYEMSPRSCHHWIRRSIAESLRTEDYYNVDTLIGGYDDYEQKAFLGSVDYLGNGVADQPYLFRGFSGRFCYSILDKAYRNDMSEEEGIAMLKKCLMESKRRFVANLPVFQMMIIDKNGFRQLEDVKL